MKRILFLCLLGFSISCSRDTKCTGSVEWFHVQIENPRNADCGFPEISFTNKHGEAYKIIGNDMGRYIALGLPGNDYNVGDKLTVRIRKPYIAEMPVCRVLGYAWSQVYITDIR